jgi:hypothetical protein
VGHLIGLLLGAEEDWPRAFETILGMVDPIRVKGTEHTVTAERLTIEPFHLGDPVRPGAGHRPAGLLVLPPTGVAQEGRAERDTYLLNSPFTFQSMEKHSAYCAMLRLG